MGLMGKASGQNVHILPQSSIPILLFQPFIIPGRLSGFQLMSVPRREGAAPTFILWHKNYLRVLLPPHVLSLFSM